MATAMSYIGIGMATFAVMIAFGLLIGMALTRELPSKAKWDSVQN